jgi:hypothetical protein
VLTAFGLTDGFTPECGAWGQGAVEAPIGWLAFMSWMQDAETGGVWLPYGADLLCLPVLKFADLILFYFELEVVSI